MLQGFSFTLTPVMTVLSPSRMGISRKPRISSHLRIGRAYDIPDTPTAPLETLHQSNVVQYNTYRCIPATRPLLATRLTRTVLVLTVSIFPPSQVYLYHGPMRRFFYKKLLKVVKIARSHSLTTASSFFRWPCLRNVDARNS